MATSPARLLRRMTNSTRHGGWASTMPLVTSRITQGKMISLAGNLSALHRRIRVRLLSAQAHPRRVRRALPRIAPRCRTRSLPSTATCTVLRWVKHPSGHQPRASSLPRSWSRSQPTRSPSLTKSDFTLPPPPPPGSHHSEWRHLPCSSLRNLIESSCFGSLNFEFKKVIIDMTTSEVIVDGIMAKKGLLPFFDAADFA